MFGVELGNLVARRRALPHQRVHDPLKLLSVPSVVSAGAGAGAVEGERT